MRRLQRQSVASGKRRGRKAPFFCRGPSSSIRSEVACHRQDPASPQDPSQGGLSGRRNQDRQAGLPPLSARQRTGIKEGKRGSSIERYERRVAVVVDAWSCPARRAGDE